MEMRMRQLNISNFPLQIQKEPTIEKINTGNINTKEPSH